MDVAEDVTDDEEEKTATPTSEPSKGDQNSSEQKTPLSLQNYYLVCDDYILRLMVMVMVSNLINYIVLLVFMCSIVRVQLCESDEKLDQLVAFLRAHDSAKVLIFACSCIGADFLVTALKLYRINPF